MKNLKDLRLAVNTAATTLETAKSNLAALTENRTPGEHGARRSIRRAEEAVAAAQKQYNDAFRALKAAKAENWAAAKAEKKAAKKVKGVVILNDGNPIKLGEAEGYLFTVSPSTAKKSRGYYTESKIPLTKYEQKMPGVVVGQNRGMLFSSSRPVSGKFVIPMIEDINLIIVDEKSRILKPIDDDENKIAWKGNGEHVVKDVIADGDGQHWFCDEQGWLAVDLWLKLAQFGYGLKGMLQPGLATDIGVKVIDHWGVERTITLGNTLLLNSSFVKGLSAYNSLEELIEHAQEWGLTTLQKQWQSGDHAVETKRNMGTQPNATNLELTYEEIEELLKPEARKLFTLKYERVAWMNAANISTARGRAIAARPDLMYKNLVMNQVDEQAGNTFLRLAQGKYMAEGQYLKMYMDKLVFSLVYVHGMDPNEAAKKAAATGLHGEIRVNPSFAGMHYRKDNNGNIIKDENGQPALFFKKDVQQDEKGRYVEAALVRYPHGAPSETIVVNLYLDPTVPADVIEFPAPVANDDGTILVKYLYAFRLQGADFDGDAVTAFTDKIWLEAQKRNAGKSYMVIPVNTEGTEKDKTPVTDETMDVFFEQKVASLSNRVGLIATSMKYFMSQFADCMREGICEQRNTKFIVDHATAMGDDIDEYKHGKAKNDLVPFVVPNDDKNIILYGPYFNRYAKKYKVQQDFINAVYMKSGQEKQPGTGVLDMFAVATERLMAKAGLPIKAEVSKASDGKDRYYFTIHPVQWAAKEVDLYEGTGVGSVSTSLPEDLETLYGIEHGCKLGVKELFTILYRDHAANCAALDEISDIEDDKEDSIKAIAKFNERYALARVAIIAWTKAMMAEKEGRVIDAVEAIKVFTTLMIQHHAKARSILDVMTETGKFTKEDGTSYEKTVFGASRIFNYFLDVCGDGLLLLGQKEPDFPAVAESIMAVSNAKAPDLEKAKEKAIKELNVIERLVDKLPRGIEEVERMLDEDDIRDMVAMGIPLTDRDEEGMW